MGDIVKDERFSHMLKDPRFRKIPIKDRKTKIDKRFQSMFKQKDFKLKYTMDKRGRPVNYTTSEDLKKFYKLSESESDSSCDETNKTSKNKRKMVMMKKKKSTLTKDCLKESKKVEDSVSSNDIVACNTENLKEDNTTEGDGKECAFSDLEKSDVAGSTDDTDVEDQVSRVKVHVSGKSDETEESDDETEGSVDETEGSDDETEESDDETEESDDETGKSNIEQNEKFDHKWQELDADAPATSETTKRLALCNMDWDRIRAEDIYAIFNSFKSENGVINDVKIYPSEYGLKRMEEEKVKGPTELVEKKIGLDDEEEEGHEGSHYHREKLRQYQINRLKYFYAVVDCDSPETANSLYEQLNGMEYESSSVNIDLRFIPDDMIFDQEPTSIASEVENLSEYKPKLFINSALQQIKVNLTWDETDPKRREVIQKAFTEAESIDKDIRNYLASSSSSSEDEVTSDKVQSNGENTKFKDQIASYRSLLQSFEEKEKKDEEEFDVEFTWEPGLKEETERLVKDKLQKKTLTPFEEELQKKKEKKKQKKANKRKELEGDHSNESSTQDNDNDSIDEEFFSRPKMTKSEQYAAELALLVAEPNKESASVSTVDIVQSKKNKKFKKKDMKKTMKDDLFTVDPQDERFSAIYTSHLYNIDPSEPQFKNTKGTQAIIRENQRKRQMQYDFHSNSNEKLQKFRKLSSDMDLVDSVKKKVKCFQKQS